MTGFDEIPNKSRIKNQETTTLWPELGETCEVNRFYKRFDSASGFIGKGYVQIWSRSFLNTAQDSAAAAYPSKFRFFASDGGGNMFGVTLRRGRPVYLSAPNIGDEYDIRYFENWDALISAIKEFDYI